MHLQQKKIDLKYKVLLTMYLLVHGRVHQGGGPIIAKSYIHFVVLHLQKEDWKNEVVFAWYHARFKENKLNGSCPKIRREDRCVRFF